MEINRSPLKAIRRYCVECSGGNTAEVRRCWAKECPLYPFRKGHKLPKDINSDTGNPHLRAVSGTNANHEGLPTG